MNITLEFPKASIGYKTGEKYDILNLQGSLVVRVALLPNNWPEFKINNLRWGVMGLELVRPVGRID